MKNSKVFKEDKRIFIPIIIVCLVIITIVIAIIINKQRGHEIDAPYGPGEISVEETDSSFGPLEQELND